MSPEPASSDSYRIEFDPLSAVLEDLRLRTVLLGETSVSAGHGWDERGLVRPRLFVMTRGRARMTITPGLTDGTTIGAGDILLVTSGPRREQFKALTRATWLGMEWETSSSADSLFKQLPSTLLLRDRSKDATRLLKPILRLIDAEYRHASSGRGTILTSLAEIALFQMLRISISRADVGSAGWLAALRDPVIAAALRALHQRPDAPWTVERLAAEAGMSRAVFAERFKKVMGDTPMNYVMRWRMHRAATMLSQRRHPLKAIVRASGYASETAFRANFRRCFQMNPAEFVRGDSTH